jgi:hypothetical protein
MEAGAVRAELPLDPDGEVSRIHKTDNIFSDKGHAKPRRGLGLGFTPVRNEDPLRPGGIDEKASPFVLIERAFRFPSVRASENQF